MVRRTDPKEDDWQNVKDAKKRKQIQDRLAQRARRERLRLAKLQSNTQSQIAPLSTKSITAKAADSDLSSDDQRWTPDRLSLVPSYKSSPESDLLINSGDPPLPGWDSVSRPGQMALQDDNIDINIDSSMVNPTIMLSPLAQLSFPLTVFTALYINGELQGIPCSTTWSGRTPAPTPAIPISLHPTESQRLVVHPRWFDRFPFPNLRDSLIKMQGVIDEEEVLRDIFTNPSFTILPGRASWDPLAWKMEKEWAVKWGWLMY